VVYYLRGVDSSNYALDEEQFEKLEAALMRARELQRIDALVELFDEDGAAPIMDFAQVAAWCRSNPIIRQPP
jgi:hypothetical protein